MKKITNIVISVFLCLAVVAGSVGVSYATEPKTAYIVVSGMSSFPLYYNGKKAFPPETDTLKEMVSNAISVLKDIEIDDNFDLLSDGLLPILRGALDLISCNDDGTSKYDIKALVFNDRASEFLPYFENELKDEPGAVNAGIKAFGADNTYFFNYDWRLDPLDHADALNDFIQMVKSKDNYDRIVLSAYSMGGAVVCSYLYKYGSSDLDSITLCSTAFQGTSCVGSLFSGDISISIDGLVNRAGQLSKNHDAENFINLLNDILYASGIDSSVENFVNNIINKLDDKLYTQLLRDIFGYMPGVWCTCDDNSYESAKAFMLGDSANDTLLKRIDEYHYNVQLKAEELLKEAQKDSNIYIVAQYNMQGLPVSETSTTSNNDELIDTKYASGGAICANIDETLPEDYTQAVECGHNHMGYDRMIDASTCMFPEQTWFIRDMSHVDYPVGEASDFVIFLSSSENQLTIHDFEQYPQFLKYDYKKNSLKPVNEETLKKSVFDKIINILSKIIYFVFGIFCKGILLPN